MKDALLGGYISRNHSEGNLTDRELKVLKNGDIEMMVSTFVKLKSEKYVQQLQCVLKSLGEYFGESIILNKIGVKKSTNGKFLCCQTLDGDMDIFLGISGENDAMIKLASKFAEEEFDTFDEDAYDAVCEMINWINGEFATRLGREDVEVVLYPPVFYEDAVIECSSEFYEISLMIDGLEFNIIMSVDARICVESLASLV